MNVTQIQTNVENLIAKIAIGRDAINRVSTDCDFIYDLLLAYHIPKASVARLQKGGLNLSKIEGEIAWKTKLFFKSFDDDDDPKSRDESRLYDAMAALKTDGKALKHAPRFVVLTDLVRLLAYDTKMAETLDIELLDLPKHYDFFLPWAGMEKSTIRTEHPADVKAAEKMAKLYDEIVETRLIASLPEIHNLNVFLSRLLFCFFAEDTGIFPTPQVFTRDLKDHTSESGQELGQYLDTLFEVLNTDIPLRDKALPQNLAAFPYVNGGLFRNKHSAPLFTKRSRQMLLDCGDMNWADINPDIFGSMIQAVITPEHRGGMGMHYTSVPNIMKVIEPLFLDDLRQEFETAKGNVNAVKTRLALAQLLKRIWNIKIFDPACGSGNFLIIAYRRLRELEMEIFKEIDRVNQTFTNQFTGVSLENFYGIELDDFAHEIAILSLWLAEHQMNQVFFKAFGRANPALPLKATGNIVHGNATRLDWETVCPKKPEDEIYILGNPPYLGARYQEEQHRKDIENLLFSLTGYKSVDYIACWFFKGANFIKNYNAKLAFVSTNSICQGEQLSTIWKPIFNLGIEIGFAYHSFKWKNNAKANAGVIVIIVGLQNESSLPKFIYSQQNKISVKNINAYLTSTNNIFVEKATTSISKLPLITSANRALDDGYLLLNDNEKNDIVLTYPQAAELLKPVVGAAEFLRGINKWCLWIEDKNLELAQSILPINTRIEKVRDYRLGRDSTSGANPADRPHQFLKMKLAKSNALFVPTVTSERRDYLPIGFLDSQTVIIDPNFAIYDPEIWIFSIISSRMQMVWLRTVSGRLKSDYRYSSTLCYNTFPFPPISDAQKMELKKHVFRIIEEREQFSEKTLAYLYDPDKMPDGLRQAHHQNDLAVERCYRSKPFESDEERLEYLFKLYEQMVEAEKEKGTLFEVEKKGKKRVKKS